MSIIVFAALVATTAGCSASGAFAADPLTSGTWGGMHMGIVITDSGAKTEYDCANGTIAAPLTVQGDGSFDWRGIHYPGHPGPTYIGDTAVGYPARYTGRIVGDRMTITLSVSDSGFVPQTFSLIRGATPTLFRCV